MSAEPTLAIDGLEVTFDTDDGPLRAVDGVDLELGAGEIVALVGESGSGKSVTALSVLGLSRSHGTHFGGEIRYGGRNLLDLSENELRSVRGAEIAMVFQDPLTALNPVRKVGWQIEEMLMLHRPISSKQARRRAVELLAEVGIPDAESRADRYPHEFSGGMRQRAMIAMAMACEPRVLIADEPTTALDVTIQAQVLDLVRRLRDRHGTSVLLDHPRPRDRGRDRRPDRRHVRRPPDGDGRPLRAVRRILSTRTRGAFWRRSPASIARGSSGCARSTASRRAWSTPSPVARSPLVAAIASTSVTSARR